MFSKHRFVFALYAVSLLACGGPDETVSVDDNLYGSSTWKWTRQVLPVCFTNINAISSAQIALVRKGANIWSYEAGDNLRFSGFKGCGQVQNPAIRIRIEDSGPRSYVGRYSQYQNPSMYLNTRFQNWSTSCGSSSARRNTCIQSIAAHEFGHALGFYHEQGRDDAPQSCVDSLSSDAVRLRGDGVNLTNYDAQSVMNYCSPRWNNDGKLTLRDRTGIRRYYGFSKANISFKVGEAVIASKLGPVLGFNNASNTSVVLLNRGADNARQRFLTASDGHILVRNGHRCLHAAGASLQDGGAVRFRDCIASSARQRWERSANAAEFNLCLASNPNYCLSAEGGAVGAAVRLRNLRNRNRSAAQYRFRSAQWRQLKAR